MKIQKGSYASEMICLSASTATTGFYWIGRSSTHAPEPFGDWGRNVDYQSVLLERPIAQLERGEGIQVDERDDDCFDNGGHPVAPFAVAFGHDHG